LSVARIGQQEGQAMTDPRTPFVDGQPLALLDLAVEAAQRGRAEGGIPIGAALVSEGRLLATGWNKRVQLSSAIRHGETDCLENAGRQPASVYARSTMITTLSPCDMCTGAILLYQIPRVIVGENRTFLGAEELLRTRGDEVIVLDDQRCVAMMQEFITAEPTLWREDIGVEE
jgi:cytosine/creatinine deaminase